jgi:uncharacterized membrane protein YsdA (DUF1294 family)
MSTPSHQQRSNTREIIAAVIIACGSVAAIAALVFSKLLPPIILPAQLILSVIAYGMYGMDKRAAQAGEWRISEAVLHIVGVLGGWPGALLAQRVFRHKTRKEEFQVLFWVTVLLNCSALGWLSTELGRDWLKTTFHLD